jgi:hypothetical protein
MEETAVMLSDRSRGMLVVYIPRAGGQNDPN